MYKSLLISLIFIYAFTAGMQTANANVFASQLKISNPDGSAFDGSFTDGTGILFSFFLNDSASSVIIRVKNALDNSTLTEIAAGKLERGFNSILWDGTGTSEGNIYTFEITASQKNYSNTEWKIFYDSGPADIYSRGLDIVTDMASPLFGLMYAPNKGGPLGTGITIYNPDGTHHDPFLVAKDVTSGGSVNWGLGSDAVVSGVFDNLGRFYVSCVQLNEIRRLNLDGTLTTIIDSVNKPLGLFIKGEGEDRTLYYCTDNKVMRAKINDVDTTAGSPEEVGNFESIIPRCVTLDDENNLYVSFRTAAADLNSEGAGLYKFPLTGSLPVTSADALWGIDAAASHRISDLQFDYGSNRTANSDDILYYSTRADGGNSDDGIWKPDDINGAFPIPVKIITENELYGGDDNINARSGLALDAAGNLILFENSNEHIFFIAPPSDETENSFTAVSYDSIRINGSTSVNSEAENFLSFKLYQNYPNPFNPSTNISFQLDLPMAVTLSIYNLLGEEISRLINDQPLSSGYHSIVFNADQIPSGVYIYKLKAGSNISTRKMSLVR